jgi:protein TonB
MVRKAGGVLTDSVISRIEPSYPQEAKDAQISGLAVVEVVVDEQGNVESARALSGHPWLRDAAVAAARQWQFKPTILRGQPVKVVGTITFSFKM